MSSGTILKLFRHAMIRSQKTFIKPFSDYLRGFAKGIARSKTAQFIILSLRHPAST
jgi:hypothetical protein